MEKGITRENTKNSDRLAGEKLEFRDHDAMTILAIPDVRVREPVDVDVQITIIDIHVRNEDFV